MTNILYAFPIFRLLLLIEFATAYIRNNNTYTNKKDTLASLSMGMGHVLIGLPLACSLLLAQYFCMSTDSSI